MKFTDGYWLMRPGVTARYAAEVAELRADEHRVTLFAPVKRTSGRADTLNSALLTVYTSRCGSMSSSRHSQFSDQWAPRHSPLGARRGRALGGAARFAA